MIKAQKKPSVAGLAAAFLVRFGFGASTVCWPPEAKKPPPAGLLAAFLIVAAFLVVDAGLVALPAPPVAGPEGSGCLPCTISLKLLPAEKPGVLVAGICMGSDVWGDRPVLAWRCLNINDQCGLQAMTLESLH